MLKGESKVETACILSCVDINALFATPGTVASVAIRNTRYEQS